MKIDDGDGELLKKWAMKKLEDISDADSDVLADYVLALFKSQEDDSRVRENCLEQLDDFLKDHTTQFVDDVFFAVRNKTYLPGYKPPQQPLSASTTASFQAPTGSAAAVLPAQPPGTQNGGKGDPSRKRGYVDRDAVDGRDPHYGRGAGGERGMKQLRRGGRSSHHHHGRGGRPTDIKLGNHLRVPSVPAMPTPPAGFPPLDPNNPLAAMMAMQAMGMPPLPNMPPLPHVGSPTYFQQQSPPFPRPGSQGASTGKGIPLKQLRQRCSDYDTQGYCALGSQCPYEHGQSHNFAPGQQQEEYDPANASMDLDAPKSSHAFRTSDSNRVSHRGFRGRDFRGRGDRGHYGGNRGGKRADFSQAGPSHDRSNTTIVVEQIPEENFTEDTVRAFFSEFGPIQEITMQAYKHLAIVRFGEYESAKRAWDSPKVIFDNRFVKVYWYKTDSLPKPHTNGAPNGKRKASDDTMEGIEETTLDPAEFARKQEEAQKAYEQKQKALQEAATKREELEAKLKAQAEERKKLYAKLAAKTGGTDIDTTKETSPGVGADGGSNVGPLTVANGSAAAGTSASTQTDTLRAKLAELEAEAESMGLSPGDDVSWQQQQGYTPRGRGYSPYRGGRGRGRGFDATRGGGGGPAVVGFRGGRGGGFAPRAGGVKRLDNRPRRVAIVAPGQEWDGGKDEALRQYLLFSGTEYEALEDHPERKDAHIVGFKERWHAEKFFTTTSIPHIGNVELSWVPNPPLPTPSTASFAPPSARIGAPFDSDTAMSESPAGNLSVSADNIGSSGAGAGGGGGMDYDVADDDDRWMD
ncbi:MAG: hypothetical protein M1821_005340 [Bathelium mastoideum]|nr:MAG: hypothetical protein M1821_005340 [Bathelium mastoideum]